MIVKFLKAENGDSILFNFLDKDAKPKNILCDGGRETTYFDRVRRDGPLKKAIENIKQKGENIDLLKCIYWSR